MRYKINQKNRFIFNEFVSGDSNITNPDFFLNPVLKHKKLFPVHGTGTRDTKQGNKTNYSLGL